MTKIEVGSTIPIVLQVFDQNAKLSVSATVIDDVGVVVAEKKLNHFQNGLYMASDRVEMPDVKFVTVQFKIDGDDYEATADTFVAVPKPRPPEKFIVGTVVSKSELKEYIIGVVVK